MLEANDNYLEKLPAKLGDMKALKYLRQDERLAATHSYTGNKIQCDSSCFEIERARTTSPTDCGWKLV